jgi:branched-chain amino acid transport system ATP-binding protein
VEQHPQAILAISHKAVVLDHGEVVHTGSAQELREQPDLLDKLLGVTKKPV